MILYIDELIGMGEILGIVVLVMGVIYLILWLGNEYGYFVT